ncbi:amidohydrolase family protein [Patescibacteria group bacterium]
MIIDVHAHTSDHSLWDLHTQTATITDLENFAQKHQVKKIILLATYFPFKQRGMTNLALLERIKDNPLFAMFGSLDVMNNFLLGVRELASLARKKKIIGIKLYPGYQVFDPSDSAYFDIYRLAQDFNLPVMFHTGELHHCCPTEQRQAGEFSCGDECMIDKYGYLAIPRAILGATLQFPQVKFIFSHLGNPFFEQLREVMAECSNVYTDISGQFLSASEEDTPEYRQELKEEMLKFLKLKNGIDRIMFGTDFPIQSYQDSIDLVKALDLSAEDEAKIFYQNAAKVLNL